MKNEKVIAILLAVFLLAVLMVGCAGNAPAPESSTSNTPAPESTASDDPVSPSEGPAVPADDELVARTYTLENAMDTTISELYVYQSKGENLAGDGLEPGEQVTVEVFGYYLHTPNETLYTVEFTADGNTYSIETLHVEDLFNVLYLSGLDAVSSATVPVTFTNLDGTAQQVESVEAPADDEMVSRIYTLENAMDTTITELYVYRSKGPNLAGENGLAPGAQTTAEVYGYYLHTPKETLHTVEFVADGDTYSFKTLHVEDLFEILYLVGKPDAVDATTGATVVAFADPKA